MTIRRWANARARKRWGPCTNALAASSPIPRPKDYPPRRRTLAPCLLALDDAVHLAEGVADIPPPGEACRCEQHGPGRKVVADAVVSGHRCHSRQAEEHFVIAVARRREASGCGLPHADVETVVNPQFGGRLMRFTLDRIGTCDGAAEHRRVGIGKVSRRRL